VMKLGGPERIRRICKDLCFSPSLLKTLNENLGVAESPQMTTYTRDIQCVANVDDGPTLPMISDPAMEETEAPWTACLSDTDHARLTLARVFIMNPEMVVIHKPVSMFNEHEAEKMLENVRAHVVHRGLDLPEMGRKFRRPRTVFFTSSTLAGVMTADKVFRVCAEGVWPISKDQVDSRLLQ